MLTDWLGQQHFCQKSVFLEQCSMVRFGPAVRLRACLQVLQQYYYAEASFSQQTDKVTTKSTCLALAWAPRGKHDITRNIYLYMAAMHDIILSVQKFYDTHSRLKRKRSKDLTDQSFYIFIYYYYCIHPLGLEGPIKPTNYEPRITCTHLSYQINSQ